LVVVIENKNNHLKKKNLHTQAVRVFLFWADSLFNSFTSFISLIYFPLLKIMCKFAPFFDDTQQNDITKY